MLVESKGYGEKWNWCKNQRAQRGVEGNEWLSDSTKFQNKVQDTNKPQEEEKLC